MTVERREHAGELMGVPGRFNNVIRWPDGEDRWSGRIANQTWISGRRKTAEGTKLQVEVRFDDNCKNGHESFGITATEYNERGSDIAGGCMHDAIAETFPELEPLIQWHLVSTDGPMHYVANTCFHASNRDHWGLLEGERRYSETTCLHALNAPAKYDWQEKYRRGGEDEPQTAWRRWLPIDMIDPESDAEGFDLKQLPKVRLIGEGKARDLDAARRTALWPEATDDELCAPRQYLESVLIGRLPAILEGFERIMRECGFIYPETVEAE